MLALVNAWRAQNQRSALVLDGRLTAAARTKSDAMARTGVTDHTIEGVTAEQNLANHGYPVNRAWWGENIAWGQTTSLEAFTWWRNSPTHNANMLNPAYRAMGAAVARVPGRTHYPTYWTQTFGSELVASLSSC